jgi:hypothetical protein
VPRRRRSLTAEVHEQPQQIECPRRSERRTALGGQQKVSIGARRSLRNHHLRPPRLSSPGQHDVQQDSATSVMGMPLDRQLEVVSRGKFRELLVAGQGGGHGQASALPVVAGHVRDLETTSSPWQARTA